MEEKQLIIVGLFLICILLFGFVFAADYGRKIFIKSWYWMFFDTIILYFMLESSVFILEAIVSWNQKMIKSDEYVVNGIILTLSVFYFCFKKILKSEIEESNQPEKRRQS